jgi:hypothetical protein
MAISRVNSPHGVNRLFACTLFIATVMTANVLHAASDTPRTGWFTPACAKQDLRALAMIEARGEVAGTPSERLGDAGLKYLQARILCLSGQENEGIALYDNIIDEPPVLNAGKAIERVRQ